MFYSDTFVILTVIMYVAHPGGRIKQCTQFVCLSVRPVPPIFSKQESRRNFQFSGNITMTIVTRGINVRSKGQRSRSLGMKMWKSFSVHNNQPTAHGNTVVD